MPPIDRPFKHVAVNLVEPLRSPSEGDIYYICGPHTEE